MNLCLLLLVPLLSPAAELKKVDCAGIQKLYPTLEKSYNRKGPLLMKGGWGNLREWGPNDFDYFRKSVLQCREQGYLKNLDPVFLEGDLEKKIEEMKKESTRLKDDVKVLAAINDYKAKIEALAKNINEESATELKNIQALLPRITGLDDSPYFNEAGKLVQRIDAILKKAPPSKKKAPKEEEVHDMPGAEALAEREKDPKRFTECGLLRVQYDELVKRSLQIQKQSVAEKEVEPMKELAKQKDETLAKMESASNQMRLLNCAKFY